MCSAPEPSDREWTGINRSADTTWGEIPNSYCHCRSGWVKLAVSATRTSESSTDSNGRFKDCMTQYKRPQF